MHEPINSYVPLKLVYNGGETIILGIIIDECMNLDGQSCIKKTM
jgi:hypothetical protein